MSVFGRRVRFWDWEKWFFSCFFCFFGCFQKAFFCFFDGHLIVQSSVTLTWLSRIAILISFWQRVNDGGHLKVLYKHCLEESLWWPPVRTLCKKVIKIDILLSHVIFDKMSIVTQQQQKKLCKTNWAWKPKPTRIRKTKNRSFKNGLSVGFRFNENRSVLVLVSVSRRALTYT
jgi:hypothetical protein